MEKISWTKHVPNDEVLQRVEDRTILQTIERTKADWISYIFIETAF
jgi:hypothetical protein